MLEGKTIMERKKIVLSCIVVFLGILSAVAAFAAEATRIKHSEVDFPTPSKCIFPKKSIYLAAALALTSVVSLGISKLLGNCLFISSLARQPNSHHQSKKLQLFYLVASTFIFLFAFFVLMTSAIQDDQHGEETYIDGYYYCHVVKPGLFAGAAVLSIVSVAVDIIYYDLIRTSRVVPVLPNQGVIAMEQPHMGDMAA